MAKLDLDAFKNNAKQTLSKQETQGIFKEHRDVHKSIALDDVTHSITLRLFEKDLSALQRSIELLGQIEPIIVRKVGNKYEVLNGNRRVAIAKKLGFVDIAADIIEANDTDALFLPYLLNASEGYDVLEIAQYLKRLEQRHGLDAQTILTHTGLDIDAYRDLFCDEVGNVLRNFNNHFALLLKKHFKERNGAFSLERNGICLNIGIDNPDTADTQSQAAVYKLIHRLSTL